jgi:hypothetical protein
MTVNKLEFGDSIAALVIDSVADIPFASSTLKMENPDGVKVEVPYVRDPAGQFDDAGTKQITESFGSA